MSSTRQVPETRTMARDELSADDAWQALRHHGGWRLFREAFLRFRYGDGFSHSRALGLQLCLAIVPFLIALSGLAGKLGVGQGGAVVADTVLALTPGASEQVVHDLLTPGGSEKAGEVALLLGLLTGLLALTTAMAQIERGANRIYGVERDRPAHLKYARAAVLAAVAGLPALAGFLMLVAGDALGSSLRMRYPGWGGPVAAVWLVVRWPASVLLVVCAVAAIFRFAPRRRQPAFSWLLLGAALSTALWWGISAMLALYVQGSGAFGATYGSLTGIMALLLWANATGVVLFFGIAFGAQLEARRVGVPGPVMPDRWAPPGVEEAPSAPGPKPAGAASQPR
ncbi:YihY/virulence factor BrkB family protein [Dactylosporangium sp. NPDC049140]|uniref:YihY/virulence factor BrkB family protein n=1 Tax=Dactylosporangium sp. NPDC049140 TaxID=3155647 RepID=UPI0033F43C5F